VKPRYDFLAIGVSAGGLDALTTIFSDLATDFPMAVCVVQHRSKESSSMCELLQDATSLSVQEVVDKMTYERGHIYLAPPDYHVLVEEGYFSLSTDVPVRYSRPSIDVMFLSVADALGKRAVGLVLTGANADGADGLRAITRTGGLAVVQDPATAEVPIMPQSALDAVPTARVVALADLAGFLTELGDAGASGRNRRIDRAGRHG
jgi:two-component system, chemotaxis family, protein-glutamate methylesterase/glutaminase